ncbi:MAG: alpha/beta hydrolase [Deltaproteobacteria bacterium]|nr:alpha/beta hydrolase [Deltaproteobacteria bacterium]
MSGAAPLRQKGKNYLLKIRVENLALDTIRPKEISQSYPLLFIHGAGGTSQCWKNYLPYFAGEGWEVFAINLRGHFPSDREEALAQVTLEDYLADVEQVINRLGIRNCAVIGHSLGGLIAQKTAENIESIRALVTLASAPPLGIALEMNHDLAYSGTVLKTLWGMMNIRPVKPTFLIAEQTVLNNIFPAERQAVFNMFVAESLFVGYQVAQGVPVDPSRIKCPKLVVGCRQDIIAPASLQESLAVFLRADYIEYHQFAHLPMLENGWETSAKDIQNWLKSTIRE